MRWKKIAAIVVAALALGYWGIKRYFGADRFRETVRTSLGRALQRQVDINGQVNYRLFASPGFSAEDVVIHDDPAFGQEPLAYVTSVAASLDVLALLRGHVEFSSVILDEPSVNVVRNAAGQLNVEPFLKQLLRGRGKDSPLPTIEVAGGRINFKAGLQKSVFYLSSVDLSMTPMSDAAGYRVDLAYEASRTDRPAQGFGSFTANGRAWFPERGDPILDIQFDLEKSAVSDLLVLIDGKRIELGGRVSSRARLKGPVGKLTIDGRIDLEAFQRWGLVAARGGASTLFYRGGFDAAAHTLLLETALEKPEQPLRFRLRAVNLISKPRVAFVTEFRGVPAQSALDAARQFGFDPGAGAQASGLLAGAVGISSVDPQWRGALLWSGTAFQSAKYSFAAEEAPVLFTGGTVRFGPCRIRDSRVAVPALAEPLRLSEATVFLNGARLQVTAFRGEAGAIKVEGDYLYQPNSARPHRFRLALGAADFAQIRKLLAPAIESPRTFFSNRPERRTEWAAEGTVRMSSLKLGGAVWRNVGARIVWDGPKLEARLESPGEPWQGGDMRWKLVAKSSGGTGNLLDGLEVEGTFQATGFEVSSGEAFTRAEATLSRSRSGVWKFSGIEFLSPTSESYRGEGQADGNRISIDLTGAKPLKLGGTLSPLMLTAVSAAP